MAENSVKTPDEILDRFINMQPEPDPENAGADGHFDAAEYERQETLAGISDFLGWIARTADEQAKGMGYPGTGKVPPEKLGELWAIVAERNIPDHVLRKTPEMIAASTTLGILGINFAHYKKQQLAGNNQPQNQEKQNDEG